MSPRHLLQLLLTGALVGVVDKVAASLIQQMNPWLRSGGWLEKGAHVAEGAFGHVFVATDTRSNAINKNLAAKIMPNTVEGLKVFSNEVASLQAVKGHNNIVNMQGAYKYNNELCLTMDWKFGGDLFEEIDKESYTMPQAASLFKVMVGAIKFIHEHNVVHLDIKPENFVFSSIQQLPEQIVLIDFGLAMKLAGIDERYQASMGTPGYIPRYRVSQDLSADVLKRSDWYALGVTLYDMLFGFVKRDRNVKPDISGIVDQNLYDLLATLLYENLLSDNPKYPVCLTADDILKHPFVAKPSPGSARLQAGMRPEHEAGARSCAACAIM